MQGFYKRPAVGNYVYGDMTGHRIDLVGTFQNAQYMYVSDDECPIPSPLNNSDPWVKVDMNPGLVAVLRPQCAEDLRDIAFPLPDFNGFKLAVNSDNLVRTNPKLLVTLATLMPTVQSDLEVLAGSGLNFLPDHFAAVVSVYPDVFTSEVQTMLATYAAQYHIPLV